MLTHPTLDMLRDLGLTREEVRRECAKSFWRL